MAKVTSKILTDPISIEDAAQRFEKFDKNSNDRISFQESGLSREEFDDLDKTGDGSISFKEYTNYLARMISEPDGDASDDSITTTGGVKTDANFA